MVGMRRQRHAAQRIESDANARTFTRTGTFTNTESDTDTKSNADADPRAGPGQRCSRADRRYPGAAAGWSTAAVPAALCVFRCTKRHPNGDQRGQ